MARYSLQEFVEEECSGEQYEREDYEADTPRWCKGCGDLGILAAVQNVLSDRNIAPENVVCVSGIGCSSRFPHYLKTYGFHGIHGRALTLSTGVKLARPDLHVITTMGDGDCFSIGAGHWLHAIRYNLNLLVLLFDNEIYALTKKQASPTSPEGARTNTTPRGAYLEALNPLTVMLGITNISFLAQTTTWLPAHLEATIQRAWDHHGLSFVRILQRCPVHMPKGFGDGGQNYPVRFLEHEDGIPAKKGFLKDAPVVEHDPGDWGKAQLEAFSSNPAPVGLLYWNPEVPTYEDIRHSRVNSIDRESRLRQLERELDRYTVHRTH